MKLRFAHFVFAVIVSIGLGSSRAAGVEPDIRLFFQATSLDKDEAETALEAIAEVWKDGYTPMLVDLARFFPSSQRRMGAPNGGDFVGQSPFGSETDPDSPEQEFPGSRGTFSAPASPSSRRTAAAWACSSRSPWR